MGKKNKTSFWWLELPNLASFYALGFLHWTRQIACWLLAIAVHFLHVWPDFIGILSSLPGFHFSRLSCIHPSNMSSPIALWSSCTFSQTALWDEERAAQNIQDTGYSIDYCTEWHCAAFCDEWTRLQRGGKISYHYRSKILPRHKVILLLKKKLPP